MVFVQTKEGSLMQRRFLLTRDRATKGEKEGDTNDTYVRVKRKRGDEYALQHATKGDFP